MTKIPVALTLAILMTTPAFALSKKSASDKAATGSYAFDASQMYGYQIRAPRYSTNPAYDVFVNGEYVGSDPDPRIRETLRHEWRGRFNDD
jgi:hypothetical protein